MLPGGFKDKRPSNEGSKCHRDNECSTKVTLGAAYCNMGICDFKCLGKTVKKGNICSGSFSGPTPGPPTNHTGGGVGGSDPVLGIDCDDGNYRPLYYKQNYALPRPIIDISGAIGRTCQLDPNSYSSDDTLDECFFDFAFGTTLIGNVLASCVAANRPYDSYIVKLAALYGIDNYVCDGTGCSASGLETPDGNDDGISVAIWITLAIFRLHTASPNG